ncbi:dolichyl-phosphate-mannose--protein mannosyltransferase [Myxacorys almedinensis]|uniref:Polyprenol-phosphate-mannose--protein mannosyltransferase n=1 Tax=Myxacorys almedinensis A TaxID=2690445 RepID=A0A8J7YYU3_9CYAN|nr:phospholipid carrier-dependent glycosyltransferase [Myxacorys almedinensis]NDJ17112.1 phospholipid carrier-dependent glycosyltransferase [Myxacorys almedinensis A]
MRVSQKAAQLNWWFWGGLISIFLVSLGLRFWGLGRFNTLVFDEVYYANFANNYLTQKRFFDGHPPLSKYLIAIGIWIAQQFPVGKDTVNSLTGSPLSPWSYRWLNALTGSFIPLVIAGIAYQLSFRRRFTLIAGLFAALDGLFLVESRYALNNVYLVIFGLLGQLLFLLALRAKSRKNLLLWLSGSGIFFAASASIKWNGLWFLFGVFLLWILAWILRFLGSIQYQNIPVQRQAKLGQHPPLNQSQEVSNSTAPLYRLTQINPLYLLLCFGVIPAIVYRLIWIPHIHLNPEFSFTEVQQQIFSYHRRVGSGSNIHPYCSTWYSWILMLRPVAYFYQVTKVGDPLPTTGSTLTLAPGRVVYDVHAMGNPVLWWLSSGAIALLVWVLIENWKALPSLATAYAPRTRLLPAKELWIGVFLFVNYMANLLPWMPVSRCVFLYHYMGASVFATMALAWFVDRWLSIYHLRFAAMWIVVLVVAAFIFWMPVYLGLPLSEQGYQMRMWLRSWI